MGVWTGRGVFGMLAAVVLAAAAGAAGRDPMHSDDCELAMDVLRQEEARALEQARAGQVSPDGPASLQTARRLAAHACLGGRGEPPLPTHGAIVPTLPVPPAVRVPEVTPSPPVPAAPAAVMPNVVTNCDPNGCWTSNGTRLPRSGPSLVGPRGACQLQGTLVICP